MVYAVFDQGAQFTLVVIDQRLNSRRVVHLLAVRPLQAQLAAIHLPFDAQPVGQRRPFILCPPGAFGGRGEQRLLVKLTVKLAQVVEGNARCGQGSQLRTHVGARQITQQAIAHPFFRDAAQLFLDRFERVTKVCGRGQLHREQTGKPAHGA